MFQAWEGSLAGVTFEGRQDVLRRLWDWTDVAQCLLRESTEHDGIEVMLAIVNGREVSNQVSLGWLPAKPKAADNTPGPDSPLQRFRATAQARKQDARDANGVYRHASAVIKSIGTPQTSSNLGCIVRVFLPSVQAV